MSNTDPTKTTETSYTLGVPDGVEQGGGQAAVITHMPHQGHRCCGGCCDVRRATIVVDIIHACFVGLGLMSVLATRNLVSNGTYDNVDDDATKAALDDFENAPVSVLIVAATLQLVSALCGIAGAVKFQEHLVVVGALGYVYSLIMAVVHMNVLGLIYPAFFLYPHVFLFQEIRAGIMSEANYPNEKHSCCCV